MRDQVGQAGEGGPAAAVCKIHVRIIRHLSGNGQCFCNVLSFSLLCLSPPSPKAALGLLLNIADGSCDITEGPSGLHSSGNAERERDFPCGAAPSSHLPRSEKFPLPHPPLYVKATHVVRVGIGGEVPNRKEEGPDSCGGLKFYLVVVPYKDTVLIGRPVSVSGWDWATL